MPPTDSSLDLDTVFKSLGGTPKTMQAAAEPETQRGGLFTGVGQGLLDLVEGPVSLAEKATGLKLAPQGVREWAKDYQRRAESTPEGRIGEFVGGIAPMFIPGVGDLGLLARAARFADAAEPGAIMRGVRGAQRATRSLPGAEKAAKAWDARPALRGAVKGAGVAAVAAPYDDQDFGKQLTQRLLFGSTLGGIAGRAGRATTEPVYHKGEWLSNMTPEARKEWTDQLERELNPQTTKGPGALFRIASSLAAFAAAHHGLIPYYGAHALAALARTAGRGLSGAGQVSRTAAGSVSPGVAGAIGSQLPEE